MCFLQRFLNIDIDIERLQRTSDNAGNKTLCVTI